MGYGSLGDGRYGSLGVPVAGRNVLETVKPVSGMEQYEELRGGPLGGGMTLQKAVVTGAVLFAGYHVLKSLFGQPRSNPGYRRNAAQLGLFDVQPELPLEGLDVAPGTRMYRSVDDARRAAGDNADIRLVPGGGLSINVAPSFSDLGGSVNLEQSTGKTQVGATSATKAVAKRRRRKPRARSGGKQYDDPRTRKLSPPQVTASMLKKGFRGGRPPQRPKYPKVILQDLPGRSEPQVAAAPPQPAVEGVPATPGTLAAMMPGAQ